MNEIFIPSLEHYALVKIATTLWEKADLRASMVSDDTGDCWVGYWRSAIEQVTSKASQLPLPQHLKGKLLGLIKPICDEIAEFWEDYYRVTLCPTVNLPHGFYFTSIGTLDRKKTVEALMENEAIEITDRYKIACTYCLPEHVNALWGRMPGNCRGLFYQEDPRHVEQSELVVFWTYHILGKVAEVTKIMRNSWDDEDEERLTPYQWALEKAILDSKKVAVEYFFNKLNPEEREDSLRYAMSHSMRSVDADDRDQIDTLCFVLSQLNKEQQLQLIEMHPEEIVQAFLQWPHQNLFTVMANHAMVFLKDFEYYYALHTIIEKVEDGYRDYDYQKLFAEFWLRGDATYKQYALNDCATDDTSNLLLSLLQVKDLKNASLVIKDATVEEKENMAQNVGSFLCSHLSDLKDLDMVQFFLSEFISSRERLVKFKDECKRSKWNISKKFFEWLDERIQNWNEERRDEEKSCSSTKRFCDSLNK